MTWKTLINFIPKLMNELDNPFNGPQQILEFIRDYFLG